MSLQRDIVSSVVDEPYDRSSSDPRARPDRSAVREPESIRSLPDLALLPIVLGTTAQSSGGDLLAAPERVWKETLGTTGSDTHEVRTPRFRVPPLPPLRNRFTSEQRWKGVVTEKAEDHFVARLTSLLGDEPDERAEFPLDVVDEEDLLLVEEGAIFYWSIGTLNTPSGRIRASQLRFARLPAWTPQDIALAKRRAEAIREEIGWGGEE